LGKIFEALDKTGLAGEIHEDLGEPNYVAAIDTGVTAPILEPPTVSTSHQNGTAEPPAQTQSQYRVVSLRVAGTGPVLPFEEASQASEQYRILRTKIVQHPQYPRTIVVSSALPRDGKSVTAINLAGALSLKGDSRVLLIDADFRHPSLWLQLGLEEQPGLAEVIEGLALLDEAIIQAREYPNLFVLPAGKPESNPSELLDSDSFTALFGRLKRMFKYLIIDSPPIATVADYDLLSAVSDGVIVVIRPDHTSRQACKKALDSVPKEKSLGVVMNCVPDWFLGKMHGYGAYY
jgi:capsular exopolysaccharide synthesis family protein